MAGWLPIVSRGFVMLLFMALMPEIGPDKGKPSDESGTRLFDEPERVILRGYDDDAMEPFLTRDGRYLIFNNLNGPSVNTDLHYAERRSDLAFQYKGKLAGANTLALEGVPTMDRDRVFYFVSPRAYQVNLSTIYRGKFADGAVSDIELVPGISRNQPGIVNFDVEVSPDGKTLYFVDALFVAGNPVTADLVIADRRDRTFQRATNSAAILKNINSSALEYAACISADGLTLFFNRAGKGILNYAAIHMATRTKTTEPFGKPRRLTAIEGFAEGATLSPDERSLYYHKKEGNRFVIYRVSKR
jgi:hypothetical protein